MATGSATINFGASPGKNEASLVVSGQTTITTGAHVEAFFMSETSADHNAEEHRLVSAYVSLTCGSIVAGTSFTIYATTDLSLTGNWSVRWVWVLP